MTASKWFLPPAQMSLSACQINVWRIPLGQPAHILRELRDRLTPEEREQEKKFHFQTDRNRYVIVRHARRDILSRYLNCVPPEVLFRSGSHGKPYLPSDLNKPNLEFNLAHSNEWALLAVTKQRAVGIDVEFIRSNLIDLDLIAQVFSPDERRSLQMLPEKLRRRAFYDCWTRKEAFVKAIGLGMSYSFQNFDVSCRPGEPAKLLRLRESPVTDGLWSMIELDIGSEEEYAAAVVVQADVKDLKLYNWGISAATI